MPIYEQQYRIWSGNLQEKPKTWWVIARTGIHIVWKKMNKVLWAIFLIASVMFIIRALQIVVMAYEDRTAVTKLLFEMIQGIEGLKINATFFINFLYSRHFLLLLLVIVTGAGLIANDRRFKALQIYFSKPVDFWDYLAGKFLVIVFYGTSISLIPALILFFMQLLVGNDPDFLSSSFWVVFSIIGYTILMLGTLANLMLLLSALVSPGTAAVLFIVIMEITKIFRLILSKIPEFGLISIDANLKQVGALLFGLEPPYPFSPLWALMMLIGLNILCLFILRMRLKPTEVVV